MAYRNNGFEITGVKDVQKILDQIAPKEAANLLRATVHGVAGEVSKKAKQNARPYRDTGTLIKAIKTKRRRARGGMPRSDVIVDKKGFYWRFLEYGTTKTPERPIFRKSKQQMEDQLDGILLTQFGKKLTKRLKKLSKVKSKR